MYLSPLSGGAPPTVASTRGASEQDQFLKIMIQQLRSQNPLEPIGNGEFLEQMSQFSQMEQFQTLNQNLMAMVALQSELAGLEQLGEATGLIGKDVQFRAPDGSTRSGTVDRVSLQNGFVRLEVGGDMFGMGDLISVGGKDDPSNGGGNA